MSHSFPVYNVFDLQNSHLSQFAYFCSAVPHVALLSFLKVKFNHPGVSRCTANSIIDITHLDGGKHKVHGCTLSWSQTSGFLSNDMLLEGYQRCQTLYSWPNRNSRMQTLEDVSPA